MTENEKKFLSYYKQNGKTATWQDLALQFGLMNARRARTLAGHVDVSTTPVPTAPEGFRIHRGSITTTGAISYGFREEPEPLDYAAIFKGLVKKLPILESNEAPTEKWEVINISDVHVGMSTKGTVYDLEWNLEEYYKRLDRIITDTEESNLILNMLGDYADGERGRTASNTHKLEQNLSDAQIFEHGLRAMIYLLDGLKLKGKGKIELNWLSNSNHPTVVDKNIGLALQIISEHRYKDVSVKIYDEAYNIVKILDQPVILTHGKDRNFMFRGLPRLLPDTSLNRLHTLMDYHGLKEATLLRGDLHQYHHIRYGRISDVMTPSLCPPSGWVSVNFLSHYRGGYVRLDHNLNPRLINL